MCKIFQGEKSFLDDSLLETEFINVLKLEREIMRTEINQKMKNALIANYGLVKTLR